MSSYNPHEIEPRWQQSWKDQALWRTLEDASLPKFYALVMFPYPSGAGLHVGHPKSYTAADITVRYKRARGFRVLHPMGWDAFGLPAERAAVREGRHPAVITRENIANFRRQIERLGLSYDWEREVNTSEPDYYRWTQWIFLKLHERGLAYLAEVPVNWCPALGTVLANEEVSDGRYVETGDPVERRMMKQWMLKITEYAERLITDLDGLDWPAGILEMQRKWIGRSDGAELAFSTEAGDLQVYTTRPDTLFGATFCVIAPEHPLLPALTRRPEVAAYVAAARNRSDLDRAAEKEKTGVFTGSYAINPATGAQVPIWVADYVLMSYGTGAIMAVPGHDSRDFAFAKAYDLPIIRVVDGSELPFEGDGVAVASGHLDGQSTSAAKQSMIEWLEARGLGRRKTKYKLRDWLFARQRYWGEPFPVAHTPDGRVVPVDDLPVELPPLEDYRPTADGQPPLARAEAWMNVTVAGEPARRDANTMPQWAGSCWYYLRYMDPKNLELPVSPEQERKWGPVDLYIGGAEHAVLHLLYARFWHKVLYDVGLVHTKEPFQKLYSQGMVLAHSYQNAAGKYHYPSECEERDGAWYLRGSDTPITQQVEKMGKSKLNSVDPMDVVQQFGADTLRLYEMFMGPLDQSGPWLTSGTQGVYRFLERVWRLFVDDAGETRVGTSLSDEARRALHLAIKETGEGIEALRLNTPIARMMELVNTLRGQPLPAEDAEKFLLILHPYAPHLAEELWSRTGHPGSIYGVTWPSYDSAALERDTLEIPVQVNGRLRGTFRAPKGADRESLLSAARELESVRRHLEGLTVVKEVVVPDKMVNFVVK